jgi:hypothetical protein
VVRLGNGTTLSIVDGLETIEPYNRSITNVCADAAILQYRR